MSGRELIIYILTNNLEDEPVFKDGRFMGFMTAVEAADKANVGLATMYTWISQGLVDCIVVGGLVYIPSNFNPPS
jgi:hypothetical protein